MSLPRIRLLTMRGLQAIHKELVTRYGGNSTEVEMVMLELTIRRAEKVVEDPDGKRRVRLAAGYGWRLLKDHQPWPPSLTYGWESRPKHE